MSETIWDRPSGLSLVTKVEINWSAGPFDNPTSGWTDVTSDVLSVSTQRGRRSENQTTPPGSATIVFNDRDGSYDPTLNDLGGPNAPDVVPGRRVRVTMSDVGSVIEAMRPDVHFPLSIATAVEPSGTPSGTMQAGPDAVQRVRPSGTSDMTQRYEGQWFLDAGAFPSVLAFKPHALETRNGTRFDQGAFIRTDVTAAFGTCSGMAWVTTTSTDATYFMGQHESFRVGINTAGKAVVDVWLDGQWQGVVSTSTIRATNQWHMVAWTIVWDDTTNTVQVRLYVDGTFEAGGEGTGTVSTSTTDRVVVGHMEDDATLGNVDLWDGELCDVAFWSGYALTDPQIERLWQMSDAGMPVFSGHVLSWQVEPRTTPVGNAIVTAECADVAQAFAQIDIVLDVRRTLLSMNPDKYFGFDDEEFEDLQGGPAAKVFNGGAFTDQFVNYVFEGPSLDTGVSDGALALPPPAGISGQPTLVKLPVPAGSPAGKAFGFWFRVAEPGVGGELLAVGGGSLVLTSTGTLRLNISGATDGSRIITNDKWHHLFVVVRSGTTQLWVDGVHELTSPNAWNGPVSYFEGSAVQTHYVDEFTIWYDTDPPDATDLPVFLGRVFEAGQNRYRLQSAKERVQTVIDLVKWTGTAVLSDRADTLCGPLRDGNAWAIVQAAAEAEAGSADIDTQGRLRLFGRHDRRRYGTTAASMLPAAGVSNLSFTTDDRYLYNAAVIDNDGVYEDAASVAAYGRRVLTAAPGLPTTNERAIRARGLVNLYKDYKPRTDAVRWELPSMFGAVGLLVDVNDMLTVSRTVFPASASTDYVQDVWVEAVEVTVDAASKRATVQAQVSPVDPRQDSYFELGTSTLESTGGDVLGW